LLLLRALLARDEASFCGVFWAGESANRKLDGRDSFLALAALLTGEPILSEPFWRLLLLLPPFEGVSANALKSSDDLDDGMLP